MAFKIFYFSSSLLVLSLILCCNLLGSEAIVNGEDASLGEFPYIVSLRNKLGNHYCAGTLISPLHVVTSVQCIYADKVVFNGGDAEKLIPADTKVVVGALSTKEGGVTHEVEKFIPHPDHDITAKFNLQNDIAIVVLKSAADTANVIPSWTEGNKSPEDGNSGTVAGWGFVSLDPRVDAVILQKLSVKIQSKKDCESEWKASVGSELTDAISEIASENIICARPVLDTAGVCVRDAGDPLIVDDALVGFVVGGYPCGRGVADLYSSLATYYTFIEQVLNGAIE